MSTLDYFTTWKNGKEVRIDHKEQSDFFIPRADGLITHTRKDKGKDLYSTIMSQEEAVAGIMELNDFIDDAATFFKDKKRTKVALMEDVTAAWEIYSHTKDPAEKARAYKLYLELTKYIIAEEDFTSDGDTFKGDKARTKEGILNALVDAWTEFQAALSTKDEDLIDRTWKLYSEMKKYAAADFVDDANSFDKDKTRTKKAILAQYSEAVVILKTAKRDTPEWKRAAKLYQDLHEYVMGEANPNKMNYGDFTDDGQSFNEGILREFDKAWVNFMRGSPGMANTERPRKIFDELMNELKKQLKS